MAATLNWFHPPVASYDQQGRGVSDHNFVLEARTPLAIFIRELLQNPLDAREPTAAQPVTVYIRWLQASEVDVAYLANCISDDLKTRLQASADQKVEVPKDGPLVMTIEDYGTTGLNGTWDDSTVDGAQENWNAFWFREGEGAKGAHSSNGGAGQGKISFYQQSWMRTLLGLTVRSSDSTALLMGRAVFPADYRRTPAEPKSKRIGYWCVKSGDQPLPETRADKIAEFRKAFKLRRQDEPGLSLVVPFPHDHSAAEAIKVVLAEFFFPIARGRLVVHINDVEISKSTVVGLADQHLTDQEVRTSLGLSLTAGYRNFLCEIIDDEVAGTSPVHALDTWSKDGNAISAAHFGEGVADTLKNALLDGKRIHVRFPLSVRRRGQAQIASFFDVHLQVPADLPSPEEAYVRQDLLIGEERRLKNAHHLPRARALTFISHEPVSMLMADAEEASHLTWNGSREKLRTKWVGGGDVLRLVRQAVPRLLSFLAAADGKPDTRALARFFARPSAEGPKKAAPGKKPGVQPPEPPPELPPPPPEYFQVSLTGLAAEVKGLGDPIIVGAQGRLEVAYEELDGNPFRNYDPFDFDFRNSKDFPASSVGCTVTKLERNQVEFVVVDPDMKLSIAGFDPNLRLVARLAYKEATDAADDEAE